MAKLKIGQKSEPDWLVRYAAYLRVIRGLKYKDIANCLDIAVGRVGSCLEEASRRGFIELQLTSLENLEAKLLSLFPPDVHSPRVIVCPAIYDHNELLVALGRLAKQYFEEIGRDGMSVAIDGGATITRMVEDLRPQHFKDIQLYPIAGGLQDSRYTSVHALVGRFLGKYGESFGLTPHFLPPPTQKIKPTRQIKKIIEDAANAEILVLGVGGISAKGATSTAQILLNGLQISHKDLIKRKAVGISAYSLFDKNGEAVPSVFDERVYKIHSDRIKQAARRKGQRVIAVAGGDGKVEALKGMLKGGWFNTLISDEINVRKLLENGA